MQGTSPDVPQPDVIRGEWRQVIEQVPFRDRAGRLGRVVQVPAFARPVHAALPPRRQLPKEPHVVPLLAGGEAEEMVPQDFRPQDETAEPAASKVGVWREEQAMTPMSARRGHAGPTMGRL